MIETKENNLNDFLNNFEDRVENNFENFEKHLNIKYH